MKSDFFLNSRKDYSLLCKIFMEKSEDSSSKPTRDELKRRCRERGRESRSGNRPHHARPSLAKSKPSMVDLLVQSGIDDADVLRMARDGNNDPRALLQALNGSIMKELSSQTTAPPNTSSTASDCPATSTLRVQEEDEEEELPPSMVDIASVERAADVEEEWEELPSSMA